jgi:uncharacterized protein (TIGR03083 family)
MSKLHERKELWLTALRTEAGATRAAFEEAALKESGLELPVPPCPGWNLLDLIHHLAGIYLWTRSHVSRGITSRPETDPRDSLGDLPTGSAAIQWWADEHAQLLALLEALDPQMPAWNWAPASKQAWFWQRRMAHETAVHRWDAQMTVGHAEPINSRLAADGISEVLDSWLPAGRRQGPLDRSGLVRLVATDLDQEWLVRLRGAGVALLDTAAWQHPDEHDARAVGRGSASDLLLALYGRVPFNVLEISGDATLLAALRTG